MRAFGKWLILLPNLKPSFAHSIHVFIVKRSLKYKSYLLLQQTDCPKNILDFNVYSRCQIIRNIPNEIVCNGIVWFSRFSNVFACFFSRFQPCSVATTFSMFPVGPLAHRPAETLVMNPKPTAILQLASRVASVNLDTFGTVSQFWYFLMYFSVFLFNLIASKECKKMCDYGIGIFGMFLSNAAVHLLPPEHPYPAPRTRSWFSW